jgi:hypothetical protein
MQLLSVARANRARQHLLTLCEHCLKPGARAMMNSHDGQSRLDAHFIHGWNLPAM